MNNVVLLLGIFITTLGLTQTSSGLTLGMSSEKILETQQLILLGTVDSVEARSGDTEYAITVLEYVKISAGFNKVDTLHVVGCGEGQTGGCIMFDEGQDVLFILNERNNTLLVSELSFVSPNPNCTMDDLFRYNDEKYDGLSLYQGSKSNRHLYTNQPITAQYYYFNKNLEATSVDVTITVVDDFPDILKEETIRLDLDECQPNAKAEVEFVIDSPGSFAISAKVEGNGGGGAFSGVKVIDYVIPPLKQSKSGIPIEEIRCKEGLELIFKASDMSPVCVTYGTGVELIERGWGTCEGLDYGVRTHPCGPRSSGVIKFDEVESYLSNTAETWKKMSLDEVIDFSNGYKEVFSYTELGRFLIKDEMQKELQKNGIENKHDDFRVFSGNQLDSLPPHISFHAVVNATDGSTYLLNGGMFANKIEGLGIKKLVFYNDVLNPPKFVLTKIPPAWELLSMEPKVTVFPPEDNRPRVVPQSLILNLERNNAVVFYNNHSAPIQIESRANPEVDAKSPWRVIKPNESGEVQFNETGEYEYLIQDIESSDVRGFGEVVVYSNKTKDLPFDEKLRIAREFIKHSDIPWTSMGVGNGKGVTIGMNKAIFYMIPDAKEYYEAWAQRWVPFDVPIIIKES